MFDIVLLVLCITVKCLFQYHFICCVIFILCSYKSGPTRGGSFSSSLHQFSLCFPFLHLRYSLTPLSSHRRRLTAPQWPHWRRPTRIAITTCPPIDQPRSCRSPSFLRSCYPRPSLLQEAPLLTPRSWSRLALSHPLPPSHSVTRAPHLILTHDARCLPFLPSPPPTRRPLVYFVFLFCSIVLIQLL